MPRQPSPAYLAVGLILVGVVALGLVIAKAVAG
jgi:putative membrane protein